VFVGPRPPTRRPWRSFDCSRLDRTCTSWEGNRSRNWLRIRNTSMYALCRIAWTATPSSSIHSSSTSSSQAGAQSWERQYVRCKSLGTSSRYPIRPMSGRMPWRTRSPPRPTALHVSTQGAAPLGSTIGTPWFGKSRAYSLRGSARHIWTDSRHLRCNPDARSYRAAAGSREPDPCCSTMKQSRPFLLGSHSGRD